MANEKMLKLLNANRIISKNSDKILSYFFKYKFELISLFFISFLYIFPRIISDANYNDDIFRSTTGDAFWWYYNGRPLVVWFMQGLNQNSLLADMTPLPVILGVVFFVSCCIFFMMKLLEECSKFTRFAICAVFIVNPFFISNISYKYDSFPMYTALGLSVVASLIWSDKSNIYKEILRSVIVISILCLYQAALSLIISLISIDFCVSALKGRVDFRQKIYRVATVIFSYLIYAKIIAPHYLRYIYVDMSQHVPFTHAGLILLKENIKT
ncbi:MAG: glucosyltransferase domain-containing protein, partial [Acetobacter sp.]|uniref:glucosyltransferase domain-containing protein n=1 Tax=Acetobacter sp. TaxID=440 RepID=UPI0039EA8DDA